MIAVGGRGQQEGYQRTLDLLAMPPDLQPDALLVSSHLMTIGAITAIRQKGKHIPAEIPVIGFDDTPWAPLFDPPLLLFTSRPTRWALKVRSCCKPGFSPNQTWMDRQHIVLPTTLVHRSSCCSQGS